MYLSRFKSCWKSFAMASLIWLASPSHCLAGQVAYSEALLNFYDQLSTAPPQQLLRLLLAPFTSWSPCWGLQGFWWLWGLVLRCSLISTACPRTLQLNTLFQWSTLGTLGRGRFSSSSLEKSKFTSFLSAKPMAPSLSWGFITKQMTVEPRDMLQNDQYGHL